MNALPAIHQSFTVSYQYRLLFTEHIFDANNRLLDQLFGEYGGGKRIKTLFVLDQGVLDHFPDLPERIRNYGSQASCIQVNGIIALPGGEDAKNDPIYVERVLREIETAQICRHSFVVAVGGGALIDMTGYAAALAHRGVRLVRIPTTVLAQNDAAVGVKNGVNYFNKKNFLGTFALPYAIINDASFLESLPDRDWISGTAEAMKVALLKDPAFFEFLEKHAQAIQGRDLNLMNQLIHRCAEIHMDHIAQGGDPFERGSSRPLDFGHWAAHKMEQLTGYALRHGEAVAVGIALDIRYATLMGWLEKQVLERIYKVFRELGFELRIPLTQEQGDRLLDGLQEFREHLGGDLTLAMIGQIGQPFDIHEVDRDVMRRAIRELTDVPAGKLSENAST